MSLLPATKSGSAGTPPPDFRDPRYFPASFEAHLQAARGGGIDADVYRNYMHSEIGRGRAVVEMLRPWADFQDKEVLDIGCGFGGLLIAAKEAGAKSISGVDIEPDRVKWANFRMQSLGYASDIRLLDVCSFETSEQLGTYDIVLAQDAVEHVADPRLALQHIARMLRPGGVVYIQVGNKFSPEQLAADHHLQLPGITMLSRPQAVEYFQARAKLPASDYAVGYWREEKWYRHVFAKCGVDLRRIHRYPTPDHVLAFAAPISDLCTRLESNLWPDLRPQLAHRMSSRIRKIAQLYVHASRHLAQIADQPSLVEQACDAIVGRMLVSVWRLVGVKRDNPSATRRPSSTSQVPA